MRGLFVEVYRLLNARLPKILKINAKFKTLTYTISYDLKDGSLEEGKINPKEYTAESEDIVLNKPTKESYTFAGWNTEADGSGTSYSDKQLMSDLVESKTPLTLYAQWE